MGRWQYNVEMLISKQYIYIATAEEVAIVCGDDDGDMAVWKATWIKGSAQW